MATNGANAVSTNSSGATLVGSKMKRQGRRRKIPIEYIQNKAARQVCFSKRRQGLFKKAFELAVLCGANIAVNVTSSSGRPYPFMHPPSNTPSVLDGCISSPQVPGQASLHASLPDVTRQTSELNVKEVTRNKDNDRLHDSTKAKVVSSNSSGATLVGSKRKRQGRRKIPIELIENESARQVCFNKRREGLFKKALELAVLCGARISVIVTSPAGTPVSFVHPPSNTPSVLDQYISSPLVPGHASQTDSLTDVTRQVPELNAKEETRIKENDGLHESIWSADVNKLSLEELKVVRTRLLEVTGEMDARAEMTTHDASSVPLRNMGTHCNEDPASVIKERNFLSELDMRNREVPEDEIDLELRLKLFGGVLDEIDVELKL